MDEIDIKILTEQEKEIGRKKYLEERKRIREFSEFLLYKTDLGRLDYRGLIKVEEIAEQIMPFFESTTKGG